MRHSQKSAEQLGAYGIATKPCLCQSLFGDPRLVCTAENHENLSASLDSMGFKLLFIFIIAPFIMLFVPQVQVSS